MPIRVKGIAEAKQLVVDEFEEWIRSVAVALDQAIVFGTPVDTGTARGGWLMDFGSASGRQTGSTAEPDTSRGNRWTSRDGNIFIHNSVEYIIYLEAGTSAQAPQGMVDPAIAAVRARFG